MDIMNDILNDNNEIDSINQKLFILMEMKSRLINLRNHYNEFIRVNEEYKKLSEEVIEDIKQFTQNHKSV